jgi:mannosyltransferase OCH1-like enzyme
MGNSINCHPTQKYTMKHYLILTGLVIFLICVGLGIYMLAVIKAPLRMDALYQDAQKLSTEQDYPPKVHQIWLDYMNIPDKWTEARSKTIKMNPNMTHVLWTSKDIEPFLAQEYPWFLDTYLAYQYFNQKVNAARYFIIYHYGGVYMDMDFIVNVSFTDIYKRHHIRDYECAFPATWPSGISTALFACKKNSRFMKFLTSNLQKSDRWCVLPYATTMWSTGPRYLTKCLGSYPEKSKTIFVLPMHYFTDVYFTHLHGSTWHRWDAQLVKILYGLVTSRWLVVIILVAIVARISVNKWNARRLSLGK